MADVFFAAAKVKKLERFEKEDNHIFERMWEKTHMYRLKKQQNLVLEKPVTK